jgi:hypothetical protein
MLIVVVYLYAAAVVQFVLDVLPAFYATHYLLMVPDIPISDRADLADENLYFGIAPLEAIFMSTVRQHSQTCVQCSNYLGDYWGRCCDLAHLGYLSTATFGNLDAQHSVICVVP